MLKTKNLYYNFATAYVQKEINCYSNFSFTYLVTVGKEISDIIWPLVQIMSAEKYCLLKNIWSWSHGPHNKNHNIKKA